MSNGVEGLRTLAGTDLGSRQISYEARDAILYALTVGAPEDRLDLVYERDLRTLPTYACALGLWAVEAAGALNVYDRTHSLHASQNLKMHKPLPAAGTVEMQARVANVYDKGKASLVVVEVESSFFTAGYSIFLPGMGGWGGERGPSSKKGGAMEMTAEVDFVTERNLAALYRLTGDLHPIHIDPEVARSNGFERPILHGLCTLGIAARIAAEQAGAHPADLLTLEARLSAPVFPGATVCVRSRGSRTGLVQFEARSGGAVVLGNCEATFHEGCW